MHNKPKTHFSSGMPFNETYMGRTHLIDDGKKWKIQLLEKLTNPDLRSVNRTVDLVKFEAEFLFADKNGLTSFLDAYGLHAYKAQFRTLMMQAEEKLRSHREKR